MKEKDDIHSGYTVNDKTEWEMSQEFSTEKVGVKQSLYNPGQVLWFPDFKTNGIWM